MSRSFSRRLCSLSRCEVAALRRAGAAWRKLRQWRRFGRRLRPPGLPDPSHDYSPALGGEEHARGLTSGGAVLILAMFVFLWGSSPLRAGEWARSVPAQLA